MGNYRVLVLVLFGLVLVSGCTQDGQDSDETMQSPDITAEQDNITMDENETGNTSIKPDIVNETEIIKTGDPGKCSREFSPSLSSGPYYNGPLFDAHFHMPNLIDPSEIPEGHSDGHAGNEDGHSVLGMDAQLEKILCNFEKENVRGTIGFVIGAEELLDKTLTRSEDIKEASGKINLFLMPAGFSAEALETIQEREPDLFSGYGEMAFYHPSYSGIPPDDPSVMAKYEVAGKNNLIVMIHPAGMQRAELENAIKNNPNVKFLIHGPEAEDYITALMDKYPNVYYSIDAVLARVSPSPAALMYMVSSKEDFLPKFRENFDLMLEESEKSWKSKIEKYPDRFMWGTDRGDPWTYDEDVSALLEEYARAFIANLDPSVQEKFAYKNAEELL